MSHFITSSTLSSLMLSSSFDAVLIFKMYVSVQWTHALLMKILQLIRINLLSSQAKVCGITCSARCTVGFQKLLS